METGVLIIILIIVVVIIAGIIGLVVWLLMREDPEAPGDPADPSDSEGEDVPDDDPDDSDDDDPVDPDNPSGDPCYNYDKTMYTSCKTVKIGTYIFRSLSFKERVLRDKETGRYVWNQSGGVKNVYFGNSSSQLYTLSSDVITVNNRNADNYMRAEQINKGAVFFGWGSIPENMFQYVFYDGSNLCFYYTGNSNYIYILRDQGGAFVEQHNTGRYYDGIKKGDIKSYIEVV